MRRRYLFRILAITAAAAVKPLAAETAVPDSQSAPPDDEISRVCELIARHLDRENAGDHVYEALIAILLKESRPFPVPDWLAEDEFWKYSQRVEAKHRKRMAGISTV